MKGERDERIEMWLDKIGVQHRFVASIQLDELDIDRSLNNQARIGMPIDPEMAASFVVTMPSSKFPPIVVLGNGTSAMIIADGNTRIHAARELGWTTYPYGAYVVDGASAAQQYMVIIRGNQWHGKPASVEDRLAHGQTLVAQYGVSIKDASGIVEIGERRLQEYLRGGDAIVRAGRLRLNVNKLPLSSLLLLHSIALDEPFKEAVRWAIDFDKIGASIQALVKKVRAEKSEADQLDVVRDAREQDEAAKRATAGLKGKGSAAFGKLSRAIGSIVTIAAQEIKSIPNELRPRVLAKFDELETWLKDNRPSRGR